MIAVSTELHRLLGLWIKADDVTLAHYEERGTQEEIPAFCLFVRDKWYDFDVSITPPDQRKKKL